MKKAFKIIFIILGATGILVLLLLTTCTIGLVKGVDGMAKSAVTVEGQVSEITAEGAILTVPLTESEVYKLEGVQICKKDGEDSFALREYSYSSSCFNSVCSTTLTFNGEVPQDVTLNRTHDGKCVTQKIPNIRNYAVKTYAASVAIPEELVVEGADRLRVEKTVDSKFSGHSSFGYNNQYKVSLSYPAHPGESDKFTVNGKTVTLKFTPATHP